MLERGHQRAPSKRPVCNYRHEAWPRGRTIGPLFISPLQPRRDGISAVFGSSAIPSKPPRNIDRLSIVDKTILGAKEFPYGRHTLSPYGPNSPVRGEDLSGPKRLGWNIRCECCLCVATVLEYQEEIRGGFFTRRIMSLKVFCTRLKLYLNIRTHLLFPAIYRGKILLAANLIGKKPDAFQVSDYTLCITVQNLQYLINRGMESWCNAKTRISSSIV